MCFVNCRPSEVIVQRLGEAPQRGLAAGTSDVEPGVGIRRREWQLLPGNHKVNPAAGKP